MRYARHHALPQVGADGQARLADSRALIIGLGGLGSPASLYLASSGVGRLTVCDFDTVDESNLPRQILYGAADVDEPKTRAAAAALKRCNPDASVTEIDGRLAAEQLAAAVSVADVVLDCTDNFASRTLINSVCYDERKTLITGAAIRFEGQLSVFDFSRRTRPCYSCLYAEDDDNLGDCAGQGVLAPIVGTIGCMMATEALKSLLEIPSDLAGKLWIYDGLAGCDRTISIAPQRGCPVCA